MNYFLLIYDRASGRLVEAVQEFKGDQLAAALQRRLQLEIENRGRPNIEIAVLSAPSLDVLKRTHTRYFSSFSEIAG